MVVVQKVIAVQYQLLFRGWYGCGITVAVLAYRVGEINRVVVRSPVALLILVHREETSTSKGWQYL